VEIQIVPSGTKIPPGQEQRHIMLEVFLDAKSNVHYEFIAERGTVQGCCGKETCMKQLVSSARQCICTSVIGGQKVPSQAQNNSFGAFACSPDLSPPDIFMFSLLKIVLKRRFTSVEEVTAKAMKALGEVS
jgi:hypothetical protein